MSTKSLIALENADGTVTSIHCHWDGKPSNNGRLLLDYYNQREYVERLLRLGSISSLRKRIEPVGQHSFNEPEEGVTVAYHRDRGDAWDCVKPAVFKSVGAFLNGIFEQDASFIYLFTRMDIWTVYKYNSKRPRNLVDFFNDV